MKLAETGKNQWWCWNFEADISDGVESMFPNSSLPRYRRVRKMKINKVGNITFLHCDCGFYHRIGFPCAHFFKLTGSMCQENFHIRHWKMYDAYYGDSSRIGQMMLHAQVLILFMVVLYISLVND